LVRDIPGEIIFVQFTLQEYFASLNLTSTYEPQALARLGPENWWREAILFAVALAKNPTPFVTALFETNPMMGAMAVAEAPTPSLDLQERAATMVIKQLDFRDDGSLLPIVTLLRKVSGKVERELCEEIGRRLEHQDERISAIAGRALATAGTSAATATLSEYPVAWKHCLETAGYLSATFEKLLFNWVETPSHPHWHDAAKLLTKRFIFRFCLIDLLKSLSQEKADFLAALIIEKIHESARKSGIDGFGVDTLCEVIPYIKDKGGLKTRLLKGTEAARMPPAWAVLTLPTLGHSIEGMKGNQEAYLSRQCANAMTWGRLGSSYVLLAASAFPILLYINSSISFTVAVLALSVTMMLIYVGMNPERVRSFSGLPPFVRTHPAVNGTTSAYAMVLFCGLILTLALTQMDYDLTIVASPRPTYIVIFMLIIAILSLSKFRGQYLDMHQEEFYEQLSFERENEILGRTYLIPRGSFFNSSSYAICMMVIVGWIFILLCNFFALASMKTNLPHWIVAVAGAVVGLWLCGKSRLRSVAGVLFLSPRRDRSVRWAGKYCSLLSWAGPSVAQE
jgi:hypothetical protein